LSRGALVRLTTVRRRGSARVVAPVDEAGTLFIDIGRADALRREAGGERGALDHPESHAVSSLLELLRAGAAGLHLASEAIEFVAGRSDRDALMRQGALIDGRDAEFLPVIPEPPKLLCVGLNYKKHAAESGFPVPQVPILFARWAPSLTGHRQPIVRPRVSEQLDWEVELAVIIGSHCFQVPKERALDVVAGYTIFNDGSIRDYQMRGGQWTAGKNFWRTGPLGPYLVTKDEVPDPQSLLLTTHVNGQEVQRENTADMIFDVRTLIAHITEWTPLEPGDIIVTGTPSGIGMARKPQMWLKPGDTVRLTIERLGVLENPVVDEGAGLVH
jgi:acylpyruvate hydrolase